MLRVGLPVHVEGELNESAKALLALAQLFLRLPQLRDVLQDAKLAQRPPRFVPRYVALAVDYSHGAIGADHPVFDVIAWTAGHQRSRSSLGRSRPVLGMNQVEPARVPFWQFDSAATRKFDKPRPKETRDWW